MNPRGCSESDSATLPGGWRALSLLHDVRARSNRIVSLVWGPHRCGCGCGRWGAQDILLAGVRRLAGRLQAAIASSGLGRGICVRKKTLVHAHVSETVVCSAERDRNTTSSPNRRRQGNLPGVCRERADAMASRVSSRESKAQQRTSAVMDVGSSALDLLRSAGKKTIQAARFLPEASRDERHRQREKLQKVRSFKRQQSFWSTGWSGASPLPAGRGLPPPREEQHSPSLPQSQQQHAGHYNQSQEAETRSSTHSRLSGTSRTSEQMRRRNRFSIALASCVARSRTALASRTAHAPRTAHASPSPRVPALRPSGRRREAESGRLDCAQLAGRDCFGVLRSAS